MYCKGCGKEMAETDQFCSSCGEPVNTIYRSHIPSPVIPSFREPEDIFLGSVTAVLFGITMIGGEIYCIAELTRYTKWCIPGGISAVLAGAICLAKGLRQIKLFRKNKTW